MELDIDWLKKHINKFLIRYNQENMNSKKLLGIFLTMLAHLNAETYSSNYMSIMFKLIKHKRKVNINNYPINYCKKSRNMIKIKCN